MTGSAAAAWLVPHIRIGRSHFWIPGSVELENDLRRLEADGVVSAAALSRFLADDFYALPLDAPALPADAPAELVVEPEELEVAPAEDVPLEWDDECMEPASAEDESIEDLGSFEIDDGATQVDPDSTEEVDVGQVDVDERTAQTSSDLRDMLGGAGRGRGR